MKRKFIKILICGLVVFILVVAISYISDKLSWKKWTIINKGTTQISWAKFTWSSDILSGKLFEKASMSIPCKIEGLPYTLSFQFDLGAGLTGMYENNLKSFFKMYPELSKNVENGLQFWNKNKSYKNLIISFGDYQVNNKKSFMFDSYGDKFEVNETNKNDTFHIGTIGSDIFQNKVLIIDYPNQTFAICDEVPLQYKKNLVDIELDGDGRVILPLKINKKEYKITFDNGSSLFPLIALTKNRPKFSTNPILDSIEISSWKQKHIVDSRMITDTFELAGKKFCNVKVYENHSGLGIDKNTDAMTGNYLFWNNTIVIDFKNKKFSVE